MYVLRTLRLQKLSSKCSGQDCKKSKNYLDDEITKCYLNFRENSGDYKMSERDCNNEMFLFGTKLIWQLIKFVTRIRKAQINIVGSEIYLDCGKYSEIRAKIFYH